MVAGVSEFEVDGAEPALGHPDASKLVVESCTGIKLIEKPTDVSVKLVLAIGKR
jgi:hypothetical protein